MATIASDVRNQMTSIDAEDDPVGQLAVMVLHRINTLPSDSPLGKQRKHMKRVANPIVARAACRDIVWNPLLTENRPPTPHLPQAIRIIFMGWSAAVTVF